MSPLADSALARTYSHRSGEDAYTILEQYRAFRGTDATESGPVALAELDISESTLQSWKAGTTPDVVKATDFAAEFGWFDDRWTPTTRALARLTAGVLACGSITRSNYRVTWMPDDDLTAMTFAHDLEVVGVGYQESGTGEMPHLRPGRQTAVLGRALSSIGAPRGDKTASSVTALPDYLDDAPPSVRADFVELLLRERARAVGANGSLRIAADRGEAYRRDLADLVESVTGVTVSWGEDGVVVPDEAVEALGLG